MRTSRPSSPSTRFPLRCTWLPVLALLLVAATATAQAEENLELRAEFEPASAMWGDIVHLHVYAKATEGAQLLATSQRDEEAPASELALEQRPDWLVPSGPWRDGPLTAVRHGEQVLALANPGDAAPLASRAFRIGYDDAPSDGAHEFRVALTHRMLREAGIDEPATLRTQATLEVEERPGGKSFLEDFVDPADLPNQGEPPVDVRLVPPIAFAGETVTMQVTVHMPEGMHTYPINIEAFGMPTEIELAGAAAELLRPRGEWIDPEPAEGPKHIDTIVFERKYVLANEAELGAHELEVTVAFMPCIPVMCFMPIDAVASTTLLIGEAGEAQDTATEADTTEESDDVERNGEGDDDWRGPGLNGTATEPQGSFRAYFEPREARAGQRVTLVVEAQAPEGHRLYPTQEQQWAQPTEITVDGAPQWFELSGTWDDPQDLVTGEGDFATTYFRGTGEFRTEFEVPSDAAAGELDVELTISYQICTDDEEGACFFPEPLVVLAQMRIEPGDRTDDGTRESDDETTDATTNGDNGDETEPESTATTEGTQDDPNGYEEVGEISSAWAKWGLLAAIGFGFLSLLTPCVFPLIPITIAHFVNLSKPQDTGATAADGSPAPPLGPSKRRMFALALTFAGAIVATFTTVAVLFSAVFGLTIDPAELATHPVLNLVLTLLLLAFALSFFGLFEIRMPSKLTTKLQTAGSASKGAFIGTFLLGIGFTLASFACTGPIMIGLLSIGIEQGFLVAVLYSVVYSISFALPFVALAMAPSMLNKLPNSGPWMVRVKVVFAFVLLFALPYFAIKADAAISRIAFDLYLFAVDIEVGMLLDRTLVLSYLAATMALFAIYLLGLIRFHLESPRDHVGPLAAIFAVLSLSMAIYLVVCNIEERPVFGYATEASLLGTHSVLPTFEAPPPPPATGGASGENGDEAAVREVVWYYAYEQARKEAIEQGRPLFVDVTGYFCSNCRVNEARVFPLPQVQDLFREMVTVKLYLDAHRYGEPHPDAAANVEQHREVVRRIAPRGAGAPYYMVIDPQSERVLSAIGPGLVSGPDFIAFLEQGQSRYNAQR